MIRAVDAKKGCSRACAVCDDCGRGEVVAADISRINHRPVVNEGQVIRKVEAQGWAFVKGKLRCPTCEAKRKVRNAGKKEQVMPDTTTETTKPDQPASLREPTPKQKREIIGLLEVAYDDERKRYKNPADSDRTIAETIGGGVLWGWVAKIREELFGPDMRSAEIEALRSDIRKLDGFIGSLKGELGKAESQAVALRQRLDKVA